MGNPRPDHSQAEQRDMDSASTPSLIRTKPIDRFVLNPPPEAIVCAINWHDNPWFPSVLRAEKDDLLKRDPEAHANVWEGKCRSAVEGAIYLREIESMHQEGRLRNVPHDPMLRVHTVWDLGWADSMAIIMVQRSASELRLIDYLEGDHRTLAEYVGDLSKRAYRWGHDWIPHDGKSKDIKTGKSTEEVLRHLGRSVRVMERDDVDEGIKAARMTFPALLLRQREHHPAGQSPEAIPAADQSDHGRTGAAGSRRALARGRRLPLSRHGRRPAHEQR